MRRLLLSLLFILTVGLAAQRAPVSGDLLLSEVLFDPVGEGADFVEIYNFSSDSMVLQQLQLVNARGTTRTLHTHTVLAPNDYLVLTDDPQDITLRFPDADSSLILPFDLPALPNEHGSITVLNAAGQRLDVFAYDADMHGELLDPEGVSLERRSFSVATQATDNWFSASSTVGYGTPTRPNSQARGVAEAGPEVKLVQTVFYPTATGLPNAATLVYRTDRPGYLAQLTVYDAGGQPVISRPRTELLSGEGTIDWDGRDDSGTLQPTGPYVLLISLFHPDGYSATFKLVTVVSS